MHAVHFVAAQNSCVFFFFNTYMEHIRCIFFFLLWHLECLNSLLINWFEAMDEYSSVSVESIIMHQGFSPFFM